MLEVEARDKLRNWQPPVSGEMIMETFGLSPSRKVGQIKDAIREAILDGEINNSFEDAYNFMLQVGKEMKLRVKNKLNNPDSTIVKPLPDENE